MKIIDIKQYKGKTYCLSLENGERLYVSEDLVFDYSLSTKKDYNEDFFEEIKQKHILSKAKKHALYSLGRKSYTYKELNDKLKELYGIDIANEVCEYMCELGYIDDESFAQDYVHDAIYIKRWGIYKVRFEMQKKGFDKAVIDKVLSQYDSEDYEEQIFSILQSRFYGKLDTPKEVQRAFGYFLRRGFNYSDVKRCIKSFVEENESDFEVEFDDEY